MVTRLHVPALPEPHRRAFAGWWQPMVIIVLKNSPACGVIMQVCCRTAAGVCSPASFAYVLHLRARHHAAHSCSDEDCVCRSSPRATRLRRMGSCLS